MSVRRASAAAVIVALVACVTAPAQPPAVPGAPPLPGGPTSTPPPGTVVPATGGAAAGGAPRNIWSFFMKTPEQKAQCKANFCNSRIGQFVNNLLVPAGAATGGLLGPVCPPPGLNATGPGGAGGPPSAADLAKPATSPEGAAAKIKAEEAQAKAKVAAIEFLGTVDCRYYPEAEAGLIAGLRAEKNECVRVAAAKALATGCCCSPKVVKALLTTVNCSNKDGFPAEASELVRTYAFVALERCLRKCAEEEPEAPPEPPPAAKKAMYEALAPMGSTVDYSAHILLASYYPLQATETPAQVYAEAHRALARGLKVSPQTVSRLSGPRNLADAVFPPDARPTFSSFALPSLPAIPSFAAIRKSAPPAETPSWLPPPQSSAATLPPPRVSVERPELAPAQPVAARYAAPTPLPPAAQPTAPATRTGRGNLLHIFQDAWRR